MPLLREWSISDHCLAAIWKIEEHESFFVERSGYISGINNDKKRLEHLTGRFLLKHLKDDFPLFNIKPDIHEKPRIDNNQYHFSISHSWPYVAVAIDVDSDTGIDIQTFRDSIKNTQHKFLSAREQQLFGDDIALLTLAWCAKEAVYKWNGKRGVEFIRDLPITAFQNYGQSYCIDIYSLSSSPPQLVQLQSISHPFFMCAFVAGTKAI